MHSNIKIVKETEQGWVDGLVAFKLSQIFLQTEWHRKGGFVGIRRQRNQLRNSYSCHGEDKENLFRNKTYYIFF